VQPTPVEEDGLNEVKHRLKSMWNNVKYGKAAWTLDVKASFGRQAPVWLLGKCYDKAEGQSTSIGADFSADFASRCWFTYRKDFPEFPSAPGVDTDCGWGCMIRSGQMLVAAALVQQRLGRDWRWPGVQENQHERVRYSHRRERVHRSIVRLFADSLDAPLSIHRLVESADGMLGRKVGDWFGPASTAHLLKAAVQRANADDSASGEAAHPMLEHLCVYVARDCAVYRQDVRDQCREASEVRRRRRQRQQLSPPVLAQSPAEENGFSVLDAPTEYPMGLLTADAFGSAGYQRLFSGVMDGVPYYEEGQHQTSDFTLLNDGRTEHLALDQSLYVNGEQWQVECEVAEEAVNISSTPTSTSAGNESYLQAEADWTPVLLLIPLRLGRDRFNPAYADALRSMLACVDDPEGCATVGVVGGRPRHSLYFVGFQEDSLIHLDPHLVQDYVDVSRQQHFPLSSFHCRQPRKLAMSKMDPSCCVGIYCETRQAFETWCENVIDRNADEPNPPFGVAEGRAAEVDAAAEALATSMSASATSLGGGEKHAEEATDFSEDFVFL